ncbi:hypothetical protein BC828DRAFT_382820 [Blastocladiella britannica]|nr:hypothetical protein BC828DRAFT_382820 [Blastocladiella britannica]
MSKKAKKRANAAAAAAKPASPVKVAAPKNGPPAAKKAKVAAPAPAAAKKSAAPVKEESDDEEMDEGDDLEDESDSEFAEQFEALAEIDQQLDVLDAEHSDKMLALQTAILQKKAPFFAKRNAIAKEIPFFWPTVLSNHDLGEMIAEEDTPLLTTLKDMVVKFDPKTATKYTIEFHFGKNDILKGNKITVSVEAKSESEDEIKVTGLDFVHGKNFITPAGAKDSKKRAASEYSGFFTYFASPKEEGSFEFFGELCHDVYPNAVTQYFAGRDDSDEENSDDEDQSGEEVDSDDE